MQRRHFLRTALALPAAGIFEPLQRLAAADLGKVKITDIKMRPSAIAYPDPDRYGCGHFGNGRIRRDRADDEGVDGDL